MAAAGTWDKDTPEFTYSLLAEVIREIPNPVSASQAAQWLFEAAAFADKKVGFKEYVDPQAPTASLYQAADEARELARWFQSQVPWFAAEPTYAIGSPERQKLVDGVTKAFAAVASFQGQQQALGQAREQLPGDIAASALDVAKFGGISLGVIAVIVGVVFLVLYLRR